MPDEEFTPIDFEAHKALSTVIRLDSFVTSFGYDIGLSKFLAEADIYLKWLENTLVSDPTRAVHMKIDGVIVGQLEIAEPIDADTGKLNLIYLLPAFRGSGHAEKLHSYAVSLFKSKNYKKAVLRCSPTNVRGFAFYKKMGWRDKGADPKHPEVHWMVLSL
jgi:ribosomal protein S18 acetylase RimI-like enzyme